MPAPIVITPNEKFWIKYYLQETYDIQINDTYSCQLLKENISKKRGIKLSCSTIRRIFDLVATTGSPSRFILDSLANAVDFKSWDTFKNYVLSFDTNVVNQNIQIYSRRLPESKVLIYNTIKNLPIHTWQGAYQFQNIVRVAIENRDFDLLVKIVQLPIEIHNKAIYEHLVIGFQSFYFYALNGHKKVIDFVQSNIANSILLQKCLLQAYVDENHLQGFLGNWIEAIDSNTVPDLLLFKNVLLCQKSFNNKQIDKAEVYFKSAIQQSEALNEIHPILKARIGVWSLILNGDKAQLEDYFLSLSDPFDKADFAVIASRLLWLYRQNSHSISFLDYLSLAEYPIVKDFFQKGRYNVLLLTMAINSFLKNDLLSAKKYFKVFSHTDFAYDIVNVDFYLPWIHRLKALQT